MPGALHGDERGTDDAKEHQGRDVDGPEQSLVHR
jgi:hypothetical protein